VAPNGLRLTLPLGHREVSSTLVQQELARIGMEWVDFEAKL
jgi:hypothetical protein